MWYVIYNIRLMVKGFFYRVIKIERSKKDKDKLKKKKKDEEIEDDKVVIGWILDVGIVYWWWIYWFLFI